MLKAVLEHLNFILKQREKAAEQETDRKSAGTEAHLSTGEELDKHTASLCSSRSLRTLTCADVASSQPSSLGTLTMWSRILQPCTRARTHTQANIYLRLVARGDDKCLQLKS